jgi:hypothetical protein
MIGAAIKAELVQATPTAGFLTDAPNPDRVYPLIMPQKKPNGPAQVPAVVYGQANTDRQALYCGTSGTVATRLTLDSYAIDYDEVHDLAKAVKDVLQDFRGLLGGIVRVKDAKLENEIDLPDVDPGLFRVSQSWVFWHLE